MTTLKKALSASLLSLLLSTPAFSSEDGIAQNPSYENLVRIEPVLITGSIAEALIPEISAELYRHLVYPRAELARRRQGQAMVLITMNKMGVTDVQVTESSGSRLMDRNAYNAAAAMDVNRIFPADYINRSIQIYVPVSFKFKIAES